MDRSGSPRPGKAVCGRRSGSAHPQPRLRLQLAVRTARRMVPGTRISCRLTSLPPSGCIRQPATAISRAAMAATPGNGSRKACGTDTSGVSLSMRRMRIPSSFRRQPRQGILILDRRNRISIGASWVRRGSSCVMVCPRLPDAAPPFWPPIQASRERSSRLGSTTCFIQSTAA